MILALSLPAHWLYQTALVRALSRGDLSLVFPVMRGTAPLLTAISASLFLRRASVARSPSQALLIASLATIVFALPEKDFGGSRACATSAAPLGAGDRRRRCDLQRHRRAGRALGRRHTGTQWSFIVWLFVLDWIGISTIMMVTRGREGVRRLRRAAR